MNQLPESRLLAIVALGVACFSAGFSLTASAYASLSTGGGNGISEAPAAPSGPSTATPAALDRSCARR